MQYPLEYSVAGRERPATYALRDEHPYTYEASPSADVPYAPATMPFSYEAGLAPMVASVLAPSPEAEQADLSPHSTHSSIVPLGSVRVESSEERSSRRLRRLSFLLAAVSVCAVVGFILAAAVLGREMALFQALGELDTDVPMGLADLHVMQTPTTATHRSLENIDSEAFAAAVIEASTGAARTAASVRCTKAECAEKVAIALAIADTDCHTVLSDSRTAVRNYAKGRHLKKVVVKWERGPARKQKIINGDAHIRNRASITEASGGQSSIVTSEDPETAPKHHDAPPLNNFPISRCGPVKYTFCDHQTTAYFHVLGPNGGSCSYSGDDQPHLCNRGLNKFDTLGDCQRLCVDSKRPQKRCSAPPVLASCTAKDIKREWWYHDGMSCRVWEFPSGSCPNASSEAYATFQECINKCARPTDRGTQCSQPGHAACNVPHVRHPYFAVSYQKGQFRCLEASPSILRGHTCLTGKNNFKTLAACNASCL
ncbi:uncharacterized protein LOC144168658 [Haemaphysalis longicornis]